MKVKTKMVEQNVSNLTHALRYASKGKPVFPCRVDKTPLTTRGFKDATMDSDKITAWWSKHPDSSIGMPTGEKSSLWVLDVDMPDGEEAIGRLVAEYGPLPETLKQRTGGGGFQYFFTYAKDFKIKNSAGKIAKDVDVRGDGGYVILPPSGHPSGNQYEWLSLSKPVPAPTWLLSMVCPTEERPPVRNHSSGNTPYGQRALAGEITAVAMAVEGTRNDQLNRSAFNLGQLIAGGQLDMGTVKAALRGAALGTGLKDSESEKTIESGITSGMQSPRYPDDFSDFNGQSGHQGTQGTQGTKGTPGDSQGTTRGQPGDNQGTKPPFQGTTGDNRGQSGDKTDFLESDLKNTVKSWILLDKRTFKIQDIYNDLNIRNRQQKKKVSDYLALFCQDGLIERLNGQRGVFSYKESSFSLINYIDLVNTTTDTIVSLPLGLPSLGIQVLPGNIIVVAGESNSGKTSILLNIAHDNLKTLSKTGQHDTIKYFSSEMGPQELHTRVKAFGKPMKLWSGMQAIERTGNFHQVIDPDGLNIIDFMEVHNEFYMVGEWIRRIYEVLSGGVCIIALQKKSGTDFGRSGEISLEKPRLYLSISEVIKGYSSCKIVKAKNYTGERNPNGLEKDFRIIKRGSELKELTEWRYVNHLERKKINAKYELLVKQESNDIAEQSIPGDETAYEFYVDGDTKRVTFRQVRQWRDAFVGLDVDAVLNELAYDSFEKPFLTQKNWFWQVSGILGKKHQKVMGG
jgi:hypothetical protein